MRDRRERVGNMWVNGRLPCGFFIFFISPSPSSSPSSTHSLSTSSSTDFLLTASLLTVVIVGLCSSWTAFAITFIPPAAHQFKNSSTGSAFSFPSVFAFAVIPEYPKLGGHGFAFVISPNTRLTGAQPSQYLGILNDVSNLTDHVFAVEFDTVQDFEFFDINDNHVGIDINNLKSNAFVPAAYFDSNNQKNNLSFKSGDTIQAWVDYDGDKKVITVMLRPGLVDDGGQDAVGGAEVGEGGGELRQGKRFVGMNA